MKQLFTVAALCVAFTVSAQDARYFADSIRKARRVPALVYAVITADSVLVKGGVGYNKFRTRDTISLEGRFHIGSATASLTSYIAEQLVLKKKILWNTSLLKVFPTAAHKCRPEYRSITLADLLSQQAGLPVYTMYLEFNRGIPGFRGKPAEIRQQFVEWIVQQKAGRDTSGKKIFRFTNANTAVAAAMLEKVSGKPWEDLLQEYVNKPLHIAVKTGWPNRLAVTEPWGHWYESSNYIALDPKYWYAMTPVFTGACDANITLGDYIVFMQDQLRGLNGKKAVMPPRSYEVIHYIYPDYALGWLNLVVKDNHISECDGTIGTFYSHTELIKEKNIAVIVMCNSGDNSAKGACINLAKILREQFVTL